MAMNSSFSEANLRALPWYRRYAKSTLWNASMATTIAMVHM